MANTGEPVDPRISALVQAFAVERGKRFLGRAGGGTPRPEVLAGWALERMGLDPLRAMGLLRQIPMPALQRQQATVLLRPLVTSIPLRPRLSERPLVDAHGRPLRAAR